MGLILGWLGKKIGQGLLGMAALTVLNKIPDNSQQYEDRSARRHQEWQDTIISQHPNYHYLVFNKLEEPYYFMDVSGNMRYYAEGSLQNGWQHLVLRDNAGRRVGALEATIPIRVPLFHEKHPTEYAMYEGKEKIGTVGTMLDRSIRRSAYAIHYRGWKVTTTYSSTRQIIDKQNRVIAEIDTSPKRYLIGIADTDNSIPVLLIALAMRATSLSKARR